MAIDRDDFASYAEVLDAAHKMGLKAIRTELIQLPSEQNNNTAVFKAIAETEDGRVFEDYGDANPQNVGSYIKPHIIRMAVTRAKARALRDLTNIGTAVLEELDDVPAETKKPAKKSSSNKQRKQTPRPPEKINGNTERGTGNGNDTKTITDGQLRYMHRLATEIGMTDDVLKAIVQNKYGVASRKELTIEQASEIINHLIAVQKGTAEL